MRWGIPLESSSLAKIMQLTVLAELTACTNLTVSEHNVLVLTPPCICQALAFSTAFKRLCNQIGTATRPRSTGDHMEICFADNCMRHAAPRCQGSPQDDVSLHAHVCTGGVEVWDKRTRGLQPAVRSHLSHGLTGCRRLDAQGVSLAMDALY